MNLSRLFENIKIIKSNVSFEKELNHISFNSKDIKDNTLFFAIKGVQIDAHDFIKEIFEENKNTVFVIENSDFVSDKYSYILVEDNRSALSLAASNFYDQPSKKMEIVGITGTNGKSSVVFFLKQLCDFLKIKAGVISTLNINDGNNIHETINTTPDPISIQKYMSLMVNNGCKYCFMEVSSHGLHQKRTLGIDFKLAAFTNISHDHLDYHKDFKEYLYCKKTLFDQLDKSSIAVVNKDDKNSSVVLQNCIAKKTFISCQSFSDYYLKLLECTLEGLCVQIDKHDIWVSILGKYNAYNILMVYAIAKEMNMAEDENQLVIALSNLYPVKGRLERVINQKGFNVFLDFAHSPDAVEKLLENLNQLKLPNTKLYTVIGCGGNRDKTKRPIMAKIAERYSDFVYLTSDNPRYETPSDIIADMEKGMEKQNFLSIENREQAIKAAILNMKKNDILAICGKGHESYQEIAGIKNEFDEVGIVQKYLN